MDTYLIETDGTDGYQVRTAGSAGRHGEIVARFSTYQQAQEWVDEQTRIAMKSANASDVA
jgi:hypothetical protein